MMSSSPSENARKSAAPGPATTSASAAKPATTATTATIAIAAPAIESPTRTAIAHRTIRRSRSMVHATRRPATATAASSTLGPSNAAPTTTTASGLVIGIDPETGKPGMPTREQMAKLAHATRTVAPAPVVLPNGIMRLDARGWSREYFVVRRGPDGKPVPSCVQGHDEAVQLMQKTPNAPAGGEEE
jgi:hypothetical protein